MVDDDDDAMTLLEFLLTSAGFEVILACDGEEALARVQERPPDLVITDHWMPGLTGLELCEELRKRSETHDVPIIVHSSQELPWTDRLYDRALTKPASPSELLREVRTLLPCAS